MLAQSLDRVSLFALNTKTSVVSIDIDLLSLKRLKAANKTSLHCGG